MARESRFRTAFSPRPNERDDGRRGHSNDRARDRGHGLLLHDCEPGPGHEVFRVLYYSFLYPLTHF